MKISIDGWENARELLAIQAAIQVLIDNPRPTDEAFDHITEVPDPVAVPAQGEISLTEPLIDPAKVGFGQPGNVATPTAPTSSDSPPAPSTAPATPPAGDGVEVDEAGVPWDKRIHSSGKTKYANSDKRRGQWKRKKGVDDATYDQVLAEITGGAAAVAPAPAPAATPAPAPANGQLTWDAIVAKVFEAKGAQLVTQEQLDAKAAELGATNFGGLVQAPGVWPRFLMELGL